MRTLVLNTDMTPIGSTRWENAVRMICNDRAELVAHSGEKVHPKVYRPTIIRLIRIVRVLWKKKVDWTKDNVHTRDGFICQYCKAKLDRREVTVDHVIPKDQGGKNTWENTVTACFPCNNKKDNRTPSQAKMYLKKRPVQPTIMEFTLRKLEIEGLTKLLDDLFKNMS